jgi:hypothetical protein
MLGNIYNWFTEGFDTDLKGRPGAARGIEQLGPREGERLRAEIDQNRGGFRNGK